MSRIVLALVVASLFVDLAVCKPTSPSDMVDKVERRMENLVTRNEFQRIVTDFEEAIGLLIKTDDRLKSQWQRSVEQVTNLERLLQTKNHLPDPLELTGYDATNPTPVMIEERIHSLEDAVGRLVGWMSRSRRHLPSAQK